MSKIMAMKDAYKLATLAASGSLIACPTCGKKIAKANAKVFCSNKGAGNCKDRYWNTVSDKRRERAVEYSGTITTVVKVDERSNVERMLDHKINQGIVVEHDDDDHGYNYSEEYF